MCVQPVLESRRDCTWSQHKTPSKTGIGGTGQQTQVHRSKKFAALHKETLQVGNVNVYLNSGHQDSAASGLSKHQHRREDRPNCVAARQAQSSNWTTSTSSGEFQLISPPVAGAGMGAGVQQDNNLQRRLCSSWRRASMDILTRTEHKSGG